MSGRERLGGGRGREERERRKREKREKTVSECEREIRKND